MERLMKKTWAFAFTAVLGLSLFAQELQHEAVAINVEVPVRVFDKDRFVEDLTMADFEVYEDGVLQKIEAVYLIKKTAIQRKDEVKQFAPETSRGFYLFFEVADFTPRLEEALDYFVQNVLGRGDNLVVVTPLKTYRMKAESLNKLPKFEIVRQLKSLIRKDAWTGNAEYREAVRDLARAARALGAPEGVSAGDVLDAMTSTEIVSADFGIDELLDQYAIALQKLENLRHVDQKKLLDFADYLKDKEGQKNVFLFYQREFIPQLSPTLFDNLTTNTQDRPDIQLGTLSLFGFFTRDIPFNIERVKQAYADSSITINFLFFTKPAEPVAGIRLVEHSEDIFAAFTEMAQATGGITDSSSNPEYLFKKASDASENYYLLYYSPKEYRADGKFKNIKVIVKNRNYRITHRAGYFAN